MFKLHRIHRNQTTAFFKNLSKIIFFWTAVNYWVEDFKMPTLLTKIHKWWHRIIYAGSCVLVALELGAFYSQHNLTGKRKADRFLMTFSHVIVFMYCEVVSKQKERISKLLFVLSVELKEHFNDEKIEKHMIRKTKRDLTGFAALLVGTLGLYGVDGLFQVIRSDENFVTLITYWPQVDDRSTSAGIARLAIYTFWWFFIIRIFTAYILVLCITISLSHQYENLQGYFRSLSEIFDESIIQTEKEKNYEKALRIGVKLHATTMWCSQEIQSTCGPVFSGQIIINVTVLVQAMSQMMNSERTISKTLSIVTTSFCALFSTSIIMLNAGDITVQAARLPSAIFQSGWQNCQNKASYRIRRLLLIAITQGQKPVEIQSIGMITISYESFLSIVKASYSLFSVLY